MKRFSRNFYGPISVIAVIAAIGAIYLACDDRATDWIKYRVEYPAYLKWKRDGGPWLYKYSEPLMLDRYRDDIVSGLSYEQIRIKLPFLVDGETFSASSYKGQYLASLKHDTAGGRLLWFTATDGFDWCVELRGAVARIALIKG